MILFSWPELFQTTRPVYKGVWTLTQRQFRTGKTMKASIFSLVLALASAKPQFEALKNVVSTIAGDYEQAPYTTLKEFDVGFWE